MAVLLQNIIDRIPVLSTEGSLEKKIKKLVAATSNEFAADTLTWISDKNESLLSDVVIGSVICSGNCDKRLFNRTCTYLIVSNPRAYFSKVISSFFLENDPPTIQPTARIHPTAIVGKDVSIGHGVVIDANCVIGDSTSIDSNSVIKKNTIIGQHVKIGANNSIGGTGFGYEKDEDGVFQQIPHIGNVVIEDYVEIGNNTAIDRAVLGSTVIRKNCKIDNLVHIAHGVEIGENSLIIAHAMIGGSTHIGKNVWVAPAAAILNKLSVADGAFVGMGAVVLKNVETNHTVVGNPARSLNKK